MHQCLTLNEYASMIVFWKEWNFLLRLTFIIPSINYYIVNTYFQKLYITVTCITFHFQARIYENCPRWGNANFSRPQEEGRFSDRIWHWIPHVFDTRQERPNQKGTSQLNTPPFFFYYRSWTFLSAKYGPVIYMHSKQCTFLKKINDTIHRL